MTLSKRTILIVVSTFIALLFILAVTSDVILLSSYATQEKQGIETHTKHVRNQIIDKLELLDLAVADLAENLSATALPRRLTTPPQNLLTEQYMRTHRIDVAAVCSTDGHLTTVKGFDCEKGISTTVPAPQQQALTELLSHIAREGTIKNHGIVNLAGTPLMISIRNSPENNTDSQVIAAVGWFIDRTEMDRIFRATGSTVLITDLNSQPPATTLRPADELNLKSGKIVSSVVDKDHVSGYFYLSNLADQPSYLVQVVEKRMLYEQGKATIAYIIIALLLACAVVCCVMLVFIRGTVLKRLASLSDKVTQMTALQDISARLPLSHHQDELNSLAVSINTMLDALEAAEKRVRESEARYRLLFERAPDAIIIIGMEGDQAGRIIAANQAAAYQHGYTVNELCSMSIHELNTDETNKVAPGIFGRVAKGEWVQAEIWHQKKDGTQFPIEIHAGLITIEGRSYTLGFDRDITLRKMTEETDHMYLEQIRQLNAELSRQAFDLSAANSELEAFNYSVSHDMRGPLTRISGYCQLLLEEDSSATLDIQLVTYINRIYEASSHLNDMIDAMLRLAQLTRSDFYSVPVNLSLIAETILRDLVSAEPDRTVEYRIEPDLSTEGDQRLLEIMMTNLLNNAWKYSAHTHDAILEFGTIPSHSVPVYYVKDNGTGFDMQDASKLFRVFSRLHDSNQFNGTGIGLATVQRIILRHGGRIWAESEVGRGTTFFFTLQPETDSPTAL
ncbi:MAG TPA: PAS domain S-box protein [Desulfuromonadales bacterium]|nr:PAS domain S-box protein [Desulfuromonadales bacterium]